MKKTYIFTTLLLLAGASAFADEVPSATALKVAKEYMEKEDLSLVWDGSDSEDSSSAFYVFNSASGGWVIVSADDCTEPILAYNDSGAFVVEGMPSNIGNWLGSMGKDIRQARREGRKGSKTVQEKWAHPGRPHTKAGTDQKTLSTPNWNQSSPYNNYLSTYVKNGRNGVTGLYTGCVATAMAEVLYYHKWPEKGTGTIGGYTTETKKYSVSSINLSNYTYDWTNMLSSYGGSATTTQKNAVALLMLHCGVMVEMDYTTSGSGAYSTAVAPALTQHMGYKKSAELKFRSDYSDSEWLKMIKEEIDNDRPIIYGGTTTSNDGHEFVCQGYDESNSKVNINWGWGGSNNGWYTLTLASGNGTYSQYQSAIFGLEPDKDGTSVYPDIELSLLSYDYNDTVNGIEIASGKIGSGETFSLNVGKIYNPSYSFYYAGAVKFVLADKDGNWKEDISEAIEMVEDDDDPGFGPNWLAWWQESDDEDIECTITGPIALGDRIAMWYRLNDGSWVPINYDGSDYSCLWELAGVDVTFIKVPESCTTGDSYTFALVPGNTPISNLAWSYDGASTEDESVALTSGTHTVSAAITYSDGTSETITQILNVN